MLPITTTATTTTQFKDEKLALFLKELSLSEWKDAFFSQQVDYELVQSLDDSSLEKLGLPLGPRMKILQKIASDRVLNQDPKIFIKGVEIKSEVLGIGHFGSVTKGVWNKTTPVALKKLHNEQLQEFLKEADLLMSFRHPNIVTCYGITRIENECYITFELVPHGDLKTFLMMNQVNEHAKMLMCKDVISGMTYLHSNNIIHRDLAARNLLVNMKNSAFVIQVSDFGMSRSITSYYKTSSKLFPVKWTSIVIQKKKSNVFSLVSTILL